MSLNYILPLKAPTPLPASGVDIVTFKVWRNTLIAHIQQDAHHHNFMPDGRYQTWRAAEDGKRIRALDDDDPDKVIIDNKRNLGEDARNNEIAQLLDKRNAQLAKFITHVATLCHHTENDDVTNCSTSLSWIFDYLKKHYGLETKGANFMDISEHVFKKGTPYQTFYKQYRASFLDNLRKRGDYVQYKNNLELTEDEKLSPSFDNAIVLWSLEKIDPRLPPKVKRNYGHQMTGNTTLKDIQPIIFENIDNMLDDLEISETSKAFSIQSLDDTVNLHALNRVNYKRNYNQSGAKQRGARDSFIPRSFKNKTRVSNNATTPSNKYCRICNLAGSDRKVYTSHEIGQCSRLSARDFESLRDALVLNGMVVLPEEDQQEPSYQLHPGWDDAEAEQLQHSDSE